MQSARQSGYIFRLMCCWLSQICGACEGGHWDNSILRSISSSCHAAAFAYGQSCWPCHCSICCSSSANSSRELQKHCTAACSWVTRTLQRSSTARCYSGRELHTDCASGCLWLLCQGVAWWLGVWWGTNVGYGCLVLCCLVINCAVCMPTHVLADEVTTRQTASVCLCHTGTPRCHG